MRSDAGRFALPRAELGLDRVLLVPFQRDGLEAAMRAIKLTAHALSHMTLRDGGLVFVGEVRGEEGKYVPAPFFQPDPVGVVVAGSPGFVASFSSLGLIRFRGHLTKGVYGVRHGRRAEAPAAA
jgi:hypothetical protein